MIVSENEYNPLDVISVFQYALKKYGNSICGNPTRLRNIMADLGPNIARDSKMLIALSSKNDLLPLVETAGMASADARILFDRMLAYLIKEEYIDRKIAYLFLNKLFDALIGKKIIIDAIEKEDISKEKVSSKSVEQGAQTDDFITKATIEQLKQRLIDEENARKKAEELAEAERIQRQLLEDRLKEEYEKRTPHAPDSNQGMVQEVSSNDNAIPISEEKQREELLRRLVCILNGIGNQAEAETVMASKEREKVINVQRSHRSETLLENVKNTQDALTLDNQRAMLVGTLKISMQRLVNVLHEIAEKGVSSTCGTYGSRTVPQSTTTASSYYRSTSSSSSSYSSYAPSYSSYSSYTPRTYVPTGRTEYVSGHWRRRNGKLEYVRPHTRRR